MLLRLGRWLRAAGYDVEMAEEGEADYQLLRRAIAQGRLFLTRDRDLAKMRRAENTVVLLASETLEDYARELTERLGVNWQFKPFTRCLQCNTPLTDANQAQRETVPKDISGPVYYCPTCQQVFWDGSHVQRMRGQLVRWHNGDYCESID